MNKTDEFIQTWVTVFGDKKFNELEKEVIGMMISPLTRKDIAETFIIIMGLGYTGEGGNDPAMGLIYESLCQVKHRNDAGGRT